MTIKKLFGVTLLAIIIVAGVFYFSKIPKSFRSTSNIKIGVILPLSGQYAFVGESDRNAMILAKEKKNLSNIEFIFEDDAYDTKKAVSAYQKLKSIDKVDAIVAVSAPTVIALKENVRNDGLSMISLGETTYHEKDNVFQLLPSSEKIFNILGESAGKNYKKISLVYANATLFSVNADNFRKALPQDVSVVDFKTQPGTDFRSEVNIITKSGFDATTVFLPLEDGVRYLKELSVLDKNHKVKLICDSNIQFSIEQYIEKVGNGIFDGCISASMADTTSLEFKDAFKKRFGLDPTFTADYAYDSAVILSDISKKFGVKRIVEKLSDKGYMHEGVSGRVKFNDDGTRLPEVAKFKFIDGKFVETLL